MKHECFVIRDIKMGFGCPQLFTNEMVAKRYFAKLINEPNSMLEFAPSDYELYKVGTYDTDTAQFDSVVPVFIVNGEAVHGGNYHD